MKELWELCRKLSNPERLGLLRKIYALRGEGLSVNQITDGMGIGQSATSQYLKQLLDLGLVRRERSGRFVGYYADSSMASMDIREIASMLYERFANPACDLSFAEAFGILGNAFRLRAIAYIAKGGDGRKESLAKKYGKAIRFITRDLEPAVKSGLLELDSEDDSGCYRFVAPADAVVMRIIDLVD